MRQVGTQPAQDVEAVSVDVTPIDDLDVSEPSQASQARCREPLAENDDGMGNWREGQICHLVFDDENSGRRDPVGGQFVGSDR